MKERDPIRVSKHVLSCLKVYLSFLKRCFKNRAMLSLMATDRLQQCAVV